MIQGQLIEGVKEGEVGDKARAVVVAIIYIAEATLWPLKKIT